MKQIIKASEQKVSAVFDDAYLFHIPVYQRPYAWEIEQVDELLDDLLSANERDPEAPYFLGSIVLIKHESEPQSEVVDGQQRLTTLAMILCVLRDLAPDQELRDALDRRIRQKGDVLNETKDQYRLNLQEHNRRFFDDNIQTQHSIIELVGSDTACFTDSQQRIATNVVQIHRELMKLTDTQRKSLAKFVANQCFLVVVTATDRDAAYRIFSVMNDRGLDLSPTDILKAQTIGEIVDASRAAYGAKWSSIEERLGRDDFRDLFTHIRMIRVKTKLRHTLQADFKEHILSKTSATEFIDEVLDPYADVYETVKDASYESTHEPEHVNRYLRYLGRLDNIDWIPSAMAFFHQNAGNHDQLVRFVKDLERLAYGLFILRANINDRIRRYAEVLRAIEQEDDLFRSRSSLQLSDDEKNRCIWKLDGVVYLEPAVVRRVLLERVDCLLALLAEAETSYAHRMITVEHVLPQNPRLNSQWLMWFPNEDERLCWTHRLANLVLLSRRKNSYASNWDFERKKKEYFYRDGVSMFAVTTQVVGETKWTPEVLERRQKELMHALIKEWRLD